MIWGWEWVLMYDSRVLVGRKKLPVRCLSLTTRQLPTVSRAFLTQPYVLLVTSLRLPSAPPLGYLTVYTPSVQAVGTLPDHPFCLF